MNGTNLGEVIGLFLAAPFVALADWFKFLKYLPPGQQELTKACHGAGMLALVALWFSFESGVSGYIADLARNPGSLFLWIPAGIAAWGAGWLLLNSSFAARALGPHRATMRLRGLLKSALGGTVWSYAGMLAQGQGNTLITLVLYVFATWCLATGATRFVLTLGGGPRGDAHGLVERNIRSNEFDWDR
jgi:hypothetical protein